MRRPRRRLPDQLVDITVRCNRGEFRLLPSKERTDILGFWLAKAQKKFPGIQIHAVCAMSNHFHIIVRDVSGQISAFMQYVLGHAAKRINRLDRIRGAVFERRFAEIAILDNPALIQRIAYAVCNPVEASLVRSHREWTGLSFFSRKSPTIHQFTVFHDGRYSRAVRDARRTGANVNRDEFFETAKLEIAHLEEGLADHVLAAVDARERELRSQQRGVLGMRRVLRSSPFDRPEISARSRMPLCFASDRETSRGFADGWVAFVGAFREASASFRAGILDAAFPRFSFRPSTSTA